MLNRGVALMVFALVAGAAQPAAAQQTINLNLGYFAVRGEDARVEDDVLNENLNFFAFDVSDFNTGSIGGEWLVPLGGYVEAGAGIGFTRRTVPSVYSEFVDRTDGSEIEQDLRLRTVPMALTFRVLPLGQASGVQPYLGGGLGVIAWRYSETGEFIDPQSVIFREQYVASGSATGPVALGGIRFGGDSVAAGFEVRYQSADAELGTRFSSSDLPDPRIDLGGWTYQVNVGFRFGR
ncbi:MAG: hypothetical protein FJW14_16625 [Acidimicrobiia bacterium]|nr:hypothetical protein [Acidimicrobiia bacterium]